MLSSVTSSEPIQTSPPNLPAIELGDVDQGDVVFCARPGFLQSLCDRAGEPWRHVGLAVIVDGQRCITEISGADYVVRPLANAIEGSETVAIARLPSADQPLGSAAADWCAGHDGHRQIYAWDDLVLTGFIAITRRYSLPQDREWLERGVAAAVDVLRSRSALDGAVSLTCSAYVAQALARSGVAVAFDLAEPRAEQSRPSVLELFRSSPRSLRTAGDSHMSWWQLRGDVRSLAAGVTNAWSGANVSLESSDDLIRWISPGDLWRSATFSERFYLVG